VKNIPIEIIQGGSFRFKFEPLFGEDGDYIDLADYSALIQFRTSAEWDETLADFNSTASIELDDSPPSIELNECGNVILNISKEVTEEFTWKKALYDVRLESPDGVVTYPFAGVVTVRKPISRTF
jgi:hypothetical protein